MIVGNDDNHHFHRHHSIHYQIEMEAN